MQEEKTEIERCDFIHVHEDVVKKSKGTHSGRKRAE